MKRQNIVAAIQARMGSTRLPGKVLKNIQGVPMLWHMYRRVKAAEYIDRVIIATTLNTYDKEIVRFAESRNLDYYAGSENDILDRMYNAALTFDATAIVRITADCPLIDPEIIDKIITAYIEDNCDYVSNWSPNKRTYPHGLEAELYSRKCLEQLWNNVDDPLLREWLPFNIHDNLADFQVKFVEHETDLSGFRWTVDYEEDLTLVRKLYSGLYSENHIFKLNDLIEFFNKNPGLIKINEKYKDKKGVEGYLDGKKGKKL